MRYAIVSDIHANMQAWKAVLQDIACSDIDRIICLGDIVGYGPRPAEVLQSVHARADHLVLGNHDAVIAGKLSAELFNSRARERVKWTAEHLSPKAVEVLGSVPLTLTGDGSRDADAYWTESVRDLRDGVERHPLLVVHATGRDISAIVVPGRNDGQPYAVDHLE